MGPLICTRWRFLKLRFPFVVPTLAGKSRLKPALQIITTITQRHNELATPRLQKKLRKTSQTISQTLTYALPNLSLRKKAVSS